MDPNGPMTATTNMTMDTRITQLEDQVSKINQIKDLISNINHIEDQVSHINLQAQSLADSIAHMSTALSTFESNNNTQINAWNDRMEQMTQRKLR